MSKATEARATDKIIEIEISQIKLTENGERTKDVATLAKSIAAVGLMVPLIVQPIPDEFKNGKQIYKLVDGHRRLAAVKANKAATVRVIEIDPFTTPEKMGVLQLTANVHRLQLTPFQEAEAIAKLRKAGRTPQEIAADLGLRPQLIARRERLLGVIPGWLKRVNTGDRISVSIAALELIAAFDEEMQKALLKRFEYYSPDVSSLKQELSGMTNRLKAAPWDLNDSLLVPEAGACTACPKRTSCQPLLFHDETDVKKINAADRCTDPACWNRKKKANFSKALATASEQHKDLIFVEDKHGHGEVVGQLKGKAILRHWKYQPVKVADKYSKPAMIANGPRAGTVIHVKIEKQYQQDRKVKSAAVKKPKGLTAEQDRKARRAKIIVNRVDKLIRQGGLPAGLKSHTIEDRLRILASVQMYTDHSADKKDWLRIRDWKSNRSMDDVMTGICERIFQDCHIPVYSMASALEWVDALRPFAEIVLGLKWSDLEAEALKAIPDPKPKAGAKVAKQAKKGAK